MDTEDLRKFIVVAKLNNLQQAAKQLHQTPSALSKVIKRLETLLNTQLFDRVGRNIVLNRQGEKFSYYAQHIVHEADQALSEFVGKEKAVQINIAGPSVLIQHWVGMLLDKLENEHYEINVNVKWEDDAIDQLTHGHAHLALVTDVALSNLSHPSDFENILLGTTLFKVVASPKHTLFNDNPKGLLSSEMLLKYPFACPSVSPFCGITRGVSSDGWRDDKVARRIGFRCNDFSVLMSLVQQGRAIAYVPDFIAEHYALSIVDVVDCDNHCEENIRLVYKPSLADGWLNKLIARFD
ncbi:MAG: LysR family transcriptional regulator [Oceanospirillaceae bacterium]|nr:LysR family transcriptional regulator [Oceanospirillaceae bacterium]